MRSFFWIGYVIVMAVLFSCEYPMSTKWLCFGFLIALFAIFHNEK